MRLITLIFVGLLVSPFALGNNFNKDQAVTKVGASAGEVKVFDAGKVMPGRFAYLAPKSRRIVEIDETGVVTNSFAIPAHYNKLRNLMEGADIEWIDGLNEYLVVIPRLGVYRMDLNGSETWYCDSEYISHDADYLSDGSVVFVNAWDEVGVDEPIFTKMSKSCEILDSLKASELDFDPSDYKPSLANPNEDSNTHANAVQMLKPKLVMLSIRNYHQVVIVSLKKRKIVSRLKKVTHVHDPVPVDPTVTPKEMNFYYADRAKGDRLMLSNRYPDKKRPDTIWVSLDYEPNKINRDNFQEMIKQRLWSPLRTLEKLPNGNFLVTGSAFIGQVTAEGELVWQIQLTGFESQFKYGNYVYKASFRPSPTS